MDEERTQTSRQRLMEILADGRYTARQLAERIGQSERQVEEHLSHVVRSLARDRYRCFMLEPPECQACGFRFRERTRLTRPSRCPKCRSESVTAPRFGIERREPVTRSRPDPPART